MPKPLDERIVEFAYIKSIAILPNMEGTNSTRITIEYELLDADKVLLDTVSREHYIPSDSKMTKQEYLTAIAGSFLGFAAGDVEALSGYVEPSN